MKRGQNPDIASLIRATLTLGNLLGYGLPVALGKDLQQQLAERHGLAEVITLAQGNSERADLFDLFVCLDAFSDDRKVQRLRKLNDRSEDGNGLGATDPVDEGLVDLDLVDGKAVR